jgi:hypothetical protein
MRSLPLIFASACYATTEIEPGAGGGGDPEDGGGGDSGVDDTADPADSGDTGDSAEAPPTLVFTTGDDVDGLGFALAAIELVDGDVPRDAGILAHADAASEVALWLDEPPGSMTTTDDRGRTSGVFIPVLFVDEDGDGEKDASDQVVGAGDSWVFWFSDDIDPSLAGLGFQPGYNAAAVSLDPVGLDIIDNGDVPYALNIGQTTSVTVGGTMVAGMPDAALGLLALPVALSYGASVSGFVFDKPYSGGDWSMTLDGRPPADHFGDFDGDGEEEAGEQPILYLDNDGSGGATPGDTPWYYACTDADQTAYLQWRDYPSSPGLALVYAVYDLDPGWMVIAGKSILDATAAGQLQLGREACYVVPEE